MKPPAFRISRSQRRNKKAEMEPNVAAAWLVRVIAPVKDENEPAERWYAVGFTDKIDAQIAMQKHPGLRDPVVKAQRRLSIIEVDRMRLKVGEVRPMPTKRDASKNI